MCGLDARTAVGGARFSDIRQLGVVTSTNDEVAALAVAGAPDGVVVVAEAQTAGRGRRGRVWESPRAGESLLVSVLVRPVPDLLTLAAGLAVVDAVASVGALTVALKWPNDVVAADGSKLAGLLAEVHGASATRAAVLGLGLNLDWNGFLPEGACSLAGLGAKSWDRTSVLEAWLVALERRLAQDQDSLLDDYRKSCSTLDRRVRVETSAGAIEGNAVDVDRAGRLLVDDHRVEAGDVIHLR